ncbi:hypothetical protein GGX14DRAFT_407334 [Mycena pura]|uniref:Uncharacterized protein n=1 Tax=Mycena pura TaxID=153505 RepID=A0AAD6UQ31_9AGAR|nr:hypothetical protein GGX14DRAFT_407334 [Mycena pura]
MTYIVDPVVFGNFSELALDEICTALMGTLLYGAPRCALDLPKSELTIQPHNDTGVFFFVLFLLAIHLLCHRKTAGRITLVVLTVGDGPDGDRAILATPRVNGARDALARGCGHKRDLPVNSGVVNLQLALGWAEDIVLVTNIVITDGLDGDAGVSLLPRLGPAEEDVPLESAPSHVGHARTTPMAPRIVFTLNLFTNLLLMLLTAGRIWWATRGARDILSPSEACARGISTKTNCKVGYTEEIKSTERTSETWPCRQLGPHSDWGTCEEWEIEAQMSQTHDAVEKMVTGASSTMLGCRTLRRIDGDFCASVAVTHDRRDRCCDEPAGATLSRSQSFRTLHKAQSFGFTKEMPHNRKYQSIAGLVPLDIPALSPATYCP